IGAGDRGRAAPVASPCASAHSPPPAGHGRGRRPSGPPPRGRARQERVPPRGAWRPPRREPVAGAQAHNRKPAARHPALADRFPLLGVTDWLSRRGRPWHAFGRERIVYPTVYAVRQVGWVSPPTCPTAFRGVSRM